MGLLPAAAASPNRITGPAGPAGGSALRMTPEQQAQWRADWQRRRKRLARMEGLGSIPTIIAECVGVGDRSE